MAVGKSGLGFALTQSIAEILIGWFISRLCIEFEEIRDHFSQPPWGGPKSKSGLRFALTWSLTGQGYLGQVHSKKVALIGLKMVPAVTKQEIPRVVRISAQSEQLCERYSKFDWFLKIACLRYEGPWSRDCVYGVPPCLVHSQKLSELIGHSDGGQKQNRTAVRAIPWWFPNIRSQWIHILGYRSDLKSATDEWTWMKISSFLGKQMGL